MRYVHNQSADQTDGEPTRFACATDFAIALGLFGLALALRLPFIPLVDVGSDTTDPIVAVQRLLTTGNLFGTGNPIFAWGRTLTYIPLVIGTPDGLAGVFMRRAALQATLAPALYLTTALLARDLCRHHLSSLLAGSVAGLLAALDGGLIASFVSGAQGYAVAEWLTLALLSLTLLQRRQAVQVGLVLGIALFGAASNHPLSVAAVPGLAALAFVLLRRRSARVGRTLFVAGATAAVLLLPHLVLTWTWSDSGGGALDQLQAQGNSASLAFSDALTVLLTGRGEMPFVRFLVGGAAVVTLSGVLVLAWRGHEPRSALARRAAVLGVGGLTGFAIVAVLGTGMHHVMWYHGQSLHPLLWASIGLGAGLLADLAIPRGPTAWMVRMGWSVLSLAAVVAAAHHSDDLDSLRQQEPLNLHDLGRVQRIIEVVEAELPSEPLAFVGWSYETDPNGPELFPLMLDRRIAGDETIRLARTRQEMVTAPTVVYVEWDPARVDLGPVVEGFGADLTSGPGFALFAVDGAAEARLMTSKLCQQPGRPEERPLLQIDALGLVDPDSRWAGSSVPAEPPCLTGEPVAEHPAATYSTRDADGAPLEVNVDGFGLDRFERPLHDWLLCAAAGECSPTPAGGSLDLPTTGVTAEQARAFCRRLGADLPTLDQWRIAALVRETGRLPEIDDFPWGREVSPDRANLNGSGMHEVGSHPSGTTWLGVEDLAGNAAEWVVVADRRYAAVGGSWRDSAGAGRASAPYRTDFSPAGDIGFRCAYPR